MGKLVDKVVSSKYFKENIAYSNIIYVIATAAGAAIVYCMMNPLRKYQFSAHIQLHLQLLKPLPVTLNPYQTNLFSFRGSTKSYSEQSQSKTNCIQLQFNRQLSVAQWPIDFVIVVNTYLLLVPHLPTVIGFRISKMISWPKDF